MVGGAFNQVGGVGRGMMGGYGAPGAGFGGYSAPGAGYGAPGAGYGAPGAGYGGPGTFSGNGPGGIGGVPPMY
jgi:hypothetical protein